MIPHTFHEATNLPDKELWKAASDREMDSLKRNNVYSLVPSSSVPSEPTLIGSRWVFKTKADSSYKARAVVHNRI